jgi:hypothetical protein
MTSNQGAWRHAGVQFPLSLETAKETEPTLEVGQTILGYILFKKLRKYDEIFISCFLFECFKESNVWVGVV